MSLENIEYEKIYDLPVLKYSDLFVPKTENGDDASNNEWLKWIETFTTDNYNCFSVWFTVSIFASFFWTYTNINKFLYALYFHLLLEGFAYYRKWIADVKID